MDDKVIKRPRLRRVKQPLPDNEEPTPIDPFQLLKQEN